MLLIVNKERAMLRKDKKLTIAVCVNIQLKALKTDRIDFSLVWHMPTIHFSGDDSKLYNRFYTKYFNDELNKNCAQDIAAYALANEENWLAAIRNWRKPILDNK